MATSPNYNWPEPDNTDLVKNGALAIRTAVDAIDTSMGELLGGTTGQVLSKTSNTSMDFTWATPSTSPASYGFAAGKNKIINGDCQVAQRGSTLTATGTAWFYGAVDRFLGYSSSASTATISQQAFTAGTAPVAGYEAQFFVRSASTNTATYLGYRMEDVRTFAGQTVTVSFWAKTNTAQTLSYFNLEQNFGSGGSGAVGTNITPLPSLTTSWQRFSGTVAVPSVSGKTIGAGSYLFLVLQGDVNKNLDLWGLQVEANSTATAFQTATGTIQGELAACQRYYRTGYFDIRLQGVAGAAYSFPTTALPMRTTPTPAFTAAADYSFNISGTPQVIANLSTTIPNVALRFTANGNGDLFYGRPYELAAEL
jgi:hypothetical protein